MQSTMDSPCISKNHIGGSNLPEESTPIRQAHVARDFQSDCVVIAHCTSNESTWGVMRKTNC